MRILIPLLLLFTLPLQAGEPDLKPKETYAVIAGVLQWPRGGISGFPTKHRKDEELYTVLLKRGVPAENMVLLLDEQATYSGIERAVKAVTAKVPADGTFIFYYCGHGSPAGAKRELCLLNYDFMPNRPELTGLMASDLTDMILAKFKGQRVLLLADCCFSGGLGKVAEAIKKAGHDAAAITSSNDSVVSTVNWTFTQTVIDALNGDALSDPNGDGLVTLGELSAEVKAAMGARERQPSGSAIYGWKEGFTLAPAKKLEAKGGKYKPGEYVIVNNAAAARVMSGADGKSVVQFYDYTEKREIAVEDAKLAPLPEGWADRKVAVGPRPAGPVDNSPAEFEVQWNNNWFPARAIKKDGAKTLIRYIGYDASWDEWVTADRIRPLSKK